MNPALPRGRHLPRGRQPPCGLKSTITPIGNAPEHEHIPAKFVLFCSIFRKIRAATNELTLKRLMIALLTIHLRKEGE